MVQLGGLAEAHRALPPLNTPTQAREQRARARTIEINILVIPTEWKNAGFAEGARRTHCAPH